MKPFYNLDDGQTPKEQFTHYSGIVFAVSQMSD
jgi:hypothetical protein